MTEKLKWELSDRLIGYFASQMYGQNWDIVLVREALQNSVDARSKTFRLHYVDEKHLVIENNGQPMTLETIRKQLFVLGESTKTDGTQTGYFGVGECAIISPCEHFVIETDNYRIEDFNLTETKETFKGTRHTLTLRNKVYRYKIEDFLKQHNVETKVIFQDQFGTHEIKPQKYQKCRKYDIPHGRFTWKKSGDSITVLRVNGVPQHMRDRYDNNGTWVIDLNTSTVLTVSREEIRDEETKKITEGISEYIRKISEHISEDKEETWYTLEAPYLFLRRSGVTLRRNQTSQPIQKMYKCLKIVDDWYRQKLSEKDKDIVWKHQIGLCVTKEETLALVKDNTILINVQDREINPPTTFSLKLIDDYTHELAHVISHPTDHEKVATTLRRIAYDNPDIYEALRKTLRY